MRKRALLFFLVLVLTFPLAAYAHGGRTDSKGGHKDSSTGTYHYHHGYPAHQHTNGECPYDFKDKTGSRSGTSSTKKKTPIATVAPTTPPKQESDGVSSDRVALAFGAGAGVSGALMLGKSFINKHRS